MTYWTTFVLFSYSYFFGVFSLYLRHRRSNLSENQVFYAIFINRLNATRKSGILTKSLRVGTRSTGYIDGAPKSIGWTFKFSSTRKLSGVKSLRQRRLWIRDVDKLAMIERLGSHMNEFGFLHEFVIKVLNILEDFV